jgi:hypothetical protein
MQIFCFRVRVSTEKTIRWREYHKIAALALRLGNLGNSWLSADESAVHIDWVVRVYTSDKCACSGWVIGLFFCRATCFEIQTWVLEPEGVVNERYPFGLIFHSYWDSLPLPSPSTYDSLRSTSIWQNLRFLHIRGVQLIWYMYLLVQMYMVVYWTVHLLILYKREPVRLKQGLSTKYMQFW